MELLCPLCEVTGAEGVVRIHTPFSLQVLSQIEKHLGSFSANPTTLIKEFRYLSQAYDLTWHDVHVILTSPLAHDERDRIQTAARDHEDQVHLTDNTMPTGAAAVPDMDPGWNYQNGQQGRCHGAQMTQCLLADMQAVSNKVVNSDKLREATQGPKENPAMFLNCLTEALTLYARLDLNLPLAQRSLPPTLSPSQCLILEEN